MILARLKEMDNKQLYNLTREQTQVFLTARLGDGCISKTKSGCFFYTTNCKHLQYLEYKRSLLGKGKINYVKRNGYSQTPIYTMYGGAWPVLKLIKSLELNKVLAGLDSMGLALWFYDDGSLHKRDLYYNLNTQRFSLKDHQEVLVPYFNSLGITAKIRTDNSHDHPLYYLGINKYEGAYDINNILHKYPVDCYSYKLWSSETIQKWSNLQEKVKSTDRDLSPRQLSYIWKSL